jgi:hypothetical protein
MTERLPVLWLYGTAAVGKTTVGWELFAGLEAPAGFVDVDQLGMCYGPPTGENWSPEPADDVGRYRLKSRNLDAVAANFRAAGAGCLVVAGVVDPGRGPAAEPLPEVALTALRLRADRADLRDRIARRGRPGDDLEEIAGYADALDRLPGPCVDTTGRDVTDVVRLVREHLGSWPARAARSGPMSRCDRPGEIIWLCGPAGIGKSAVGWAVYRRLRAAGRRAAFVDLDQVGFRRPASWGNHRLKAANLAALWDNYAADGAHCLVTVGPVTPAAVATYRAALPAATFTLVRLTATPRTLADRVWARGRGESPAAGLAGDGIAGQPAAVLDRIAAKSIRQAAESERAGAGDFAIATDGWSPADLAAEIVDRNG